MILTNKSKAINFIVGGIIGAVLSIGILMIAIFYDIEKDTKIELNSDAYLAQDDCLIDPKQTIFGVWKGKKYYPESDKLQKWTVSRFPNGSFIILFETKVGDKTLVSNENGLWSNSQCLYSTVTKKRNNEDVLFLEIYRVHILSTNKMVYTSYLTGESFTVYRDISSDLEKANKISI